MTVPDREDESGERELESREYRHRHIDIDIDIDTDSRRRRKTKARRFYVPWQFEFDFQEMEKILAREGKTFSKWIREEVTHYVMLHGPGNPQQRIDTIMELGKPYVAGQCGDCNDKAIYQANLGTKKVFLCSFHFSRKKHKLTGWKEL
jgi:hypothetical protein